MRSPGALLAVIRRRFARRTQREVLLGCFCLGPDATWPEVRLAYLDMVQVWHPDRFENNPRLKAKAQAAMEELNAAYELLSSYFP